MAPPPKVAPVIARDTPLQMVVLLPAFIVGAKLTVSTTLLLAERQGPAGSSVVNVNVIVPLLVAIGVNTTAAGFAVGPMLLN